MNFYKIVLVLVTFLSINTLSSAAVGDIENRLIYSEYSKKISMDFRDVSLSDVLKIFSKQSGMNFISALDVSKIKITLFLDNVPIEEALEKILDANDLSYEITQDSNVFVVKQKDKNKTITKVFPLKFATVSNSSLNSSISGSSTSTSNTNGLKSALDAIKSKDGKIEEDSRTNSIIITDNPEQFPLFEETISKLDIPVLQILIEVEILDVSKDDVDLIGMNFTGSPFSFTAPSNSIWDPTNLFDKTLKADPTTGAITTKSPFPYTVASRAVSLGSVGPSGYSGALDFLKTRSNTKNLARPRILTLNNQTAKIEVGGDTTTNIKRTTTISNGLNTVADDPQSKPTGVILLVTPQANAENGDIIMKIAPEINDIIKTPFSTGVSPDKNSVFDVEKRKTESILRAKNGETIIIGGLMRTVKSEKIDKLPFLGDMPLVGAAFRHNDSSIQNREIIIFLTPHILDENYKKKLDAEANRPLSREGIDSSKMIAINQQLDSSELK